MNKLLMFLLFSLMSLLGMSAQATSYIDPSVSGIFTQLGTDSSTLIGYGWVLFGVIVAGLIMFRIVKKVMGKAV